MFIAVRDRTKKLLEASGAVRADRLIHGGYQECYSNWDVLACIDRMIELGEIQEISKDVCGQYRVFTYQTA